MFKTTFALALAVAAISTSLTAPADAAIRQNGLTSNGMQLNGITINGITINGITINGVKMNGMQLNGITINGTTTGAPIKHVAPTGERPVATFTVSNVTLADGSVAVVS